MRAFHKQMTARYGRACPGYGMVRGWRQRGTWRDLAWPPPPEFVGRIASLLGVRKKDLTR